MPNENNKRYLTSHGPDPKIFKRPRKNTSIPPPTTSTVQTGSYEGISYTIDETATYNRYAQEGMRFYNGAGKGRNTVWAGLGSAKADAMCKKQEKVALFANPKNSNICWLNSLVGLMLKMAALFTLRATPECEKNTAGGRLRECITRMVKQTGGGRVFNLLDAEPDHHGVSVLNMCHEIAGVARINTYNNQYDMVDFLKPVMDTCFGDRISNTMIEFKLGCTHGCVKHGTVHNQSTHSVFVTVPEKCARYSLVKNVAAVVADLPSTVHHTRICVECGNAVYKYESEMLVLSECLVVQVQRAVQNKPGKPVKVKKACKVNKNLVVDVGGITHKFECVGVVQHTGNETTSGHFTLYTNNNKKGWNYINDSFHDCDSYPKQPYVCIYKKITSNCMKVC